MVAEVIDADTLRLDNGREVRLVGALAPRAMFGRFLPEHEAEAKAALETLVAARTVALGFQEGSEREDRHGVLLANVHVERTWVQGWMVREGRALAYGLPGWFGCMATLLAEERTARAREVGLWSRSRIVPARETPTLLRRRNAFQIVSGKVERVTVTKKRVYIDFGADWREDFTVGFVRDSLSAETIARLEALAGKEVEARGWIERRFGPYMDVWDESQISFSESAGKE